MRSDQFITDQERSDRIRADLKTEWMSSRYYTPRQIATKLGKNIDTVRLWYRIGIKDRSRSRTVVLETMVQGGRIAIKGSQIIDFLVDIN